MSKSSHKVICPKCFEYGYLTKEGKYFKVAHNIRIKKGDWIVKRHHIGTAEKVLEKFREISKNRPDVFDPKLFQEIKDNLPKSFDQEYKEQIKSSSEATLITKIFELSKSLGEGWVETRHALYRDGIWNRANCPHCGEEVQFLFMRDGNFRNVKLSKPKSKTEN